MPTETAPLPAAPLVPKHVDLKLRRVMRPELVVAPGDFTTVALEPALDDPRGPTYMLTLCDHYGVRWEFPCTTGRARDGVYVITGTTREPSLRPHLQLTRYRGYIAFGALTPDLTP